MWDLLGCRKSAVEEDKAVRTHVRHSIPVDLYGQFTVQEVPKIQIVQSSPTYDLRFYAKEEAGGSIGDSSTAWGNEGAAGESRSSCNEEGGNSELHGVRYDFQCKSMRSNMKTSDFRM